MDALLHSISYAGTWGQAFLTVEQFVDKAAELGYDGVLLAAKRPHVSLLDFERRARTRLRRRIEKRGLRRVVVAGYNNFTADLEHADIPNQEIQIQYVTELARLAAELGADLVRIFTGYESPAASYSAQWNLVVSALKQCARRAARFGVTLGVQNHHDIAAGFESLYDLLQAVDEPNCKAMFDAWAPALQGADILAAARKMGAVTAHTTIADYQRRPRYRYEPAVVNYTPLAPYVLAVPIGQGFIDYRAFLGALREGGFQGTVAYEMCSPLAGGGSMENLDRCARLFLEFIRSV